VPCAKSFLQWGSNILSYPGFRKAEWSFQCDGIFLPANQPELPLAYSAIEGRKAGFERVKSSVSILSSILQRRNRKRYSRQVQNGIRLWQCSFRKKGCTSSAVIFSLH